MNGLIASDRAREKAVTLRRLLIRVENGRGDDRGLSADLLEGLDVTSLVGDPVSEIQAAIRIGRVTRQQPLDVLRVTLRDLTARVTSGSICVEQVTEIVVARAICAVVLRLEIARLESPPA